MSVCLFVCLCVCLPVCLSANRSPELRVQNSPNLQHTLPMAAGSPCTKGSLVLVTAVVSKTGRNQHKAAEALACALRFSDVAATVSTWIRRVMYGKNNVIHKPERHNVSQRRQMRTEPRPWVTCVADLVNFVRVIPEIG